MVIGQYEVLDKLGSGGFAHVYKVEHPIDGEVLALKWLFRKSDFDVRSRPYYEEIQRRFIEEARILRRLKDVRGVINIYSLETYEGRPFYTMELMGESLADRFGETDDK